jgi:hypothetical protein
LLGVVVDRVRDSGFIVKYPFPSVTGEMFLGFGVNPFSRWDFVSALWLRISSRPSFRVDGNELRRGDWGYVTEDHRRRGGLRGDRGWMSARRGVLGLGRKGTLKPFVTGLADKTRGEEEGGRDEGMVGPFAQCWSTFCMSRGREGVERERGMVALATSESIERDFGPCSVWGELAMRHQDIRMRIATIARFWNATSRSGDTPRHVTTRHKFGNTNTGVSMVVRKFAKCVCQNVRISF